MIYIRNILFILSVTLLSTVNIYSQQNIEEDSTNLDYFQDNYLRYKDYVYQPQIKTAKIYVVDDVFNNPVIQLNGNQQLLFEFDEISDLSKDYTYRIIHCSSDWEESNVSVFDYMEGFEVNPIRDFSFSFNTYYNYVHYKLLIPNDDVKLNYSGNYLIVVYDNDIPVVSKRFYIVETKADVELNIDRPDLIEYRNSHQEVDFTITTHINIPDPYNDVKVVVRQNGKYDDELQDLKPLYIKDNKLIYDYQDDNCFLGLNEFRYFNCKDIRFESHGIDSIQYINPYYHFYLESSEKRRFKVYFYDEELNGDYLIDVAGGVNLETEADYVYVYFTLPYDAPIVNGNLYIYGALSNWDCTSENKMTYNYDKKRYECTMLLKQGYYNYMYAFLEDGVKSADLSYIEGSHYETDNTYSVFVYLKQRSERYDQLISVETGSSIAKIK